MEEAGHVLFAGNLPVGLAVPRGTASFFTPDIGFFLLTKP
jgi:hypothetical protein